jgi:hypothetical protein
MSVVAATDEFVYDLDESVQILFDLIRFLIRSLDGLVGPNDGLAVLVAYLNQNMDGPANGIDLDLLTFNCRSQALNITSEPVQAPVELAQIGRKLRLLREDELNGLFDVHCAILAQKKGPRR